MAKSHGAIFKQNEKWICKVIVELFGNMGKRGKMSKNGKKWVSGLTTFIYEEKKEKGDQ